MYQYQQQPFDGAEFAENPEPRCPCLLLLDVSWSMQGESLDQLNQGLSQFREELLDDSLASKRVEVSIVTFGPVKVINDFTSVQEWIVPILEARGMTPMGEAIEHGLTLLHHRKEIYRSNGISYYRPWVFLITDGEPNDEWHNAAQLVKDGEAQKAFSFFAVGTEDADFEILNQISVRQALRLKQLRFRDLFSWLSSSLAKVSHSNPEDRLLLDNPATPQGWAAI